MDLSFCLFFGKSEKGKGKIKKSLNCFKNVRVHSSVKTCNRPSTGIYVYVALVANYMPDLAM